MQLEILTFCDAAAEYGGRLNILGDGHRDCDRSAAQISPLRHCGAQLRAARIEEGDHTVRLMIIDADGAPILNLDGKMAIRFAAGMNGVVNLIINAQQLEFREAGEYAIEVAVDGIQLGSCPFYVRRRDYGDPKS
ncbi:MAG: hypothetical protein R3E79_46900 [Caldilineaceae bacterium]